MTHVSSLLVLEQLHFIGRNCMELNPTLVVLVHVCSLKINDPPSKKKTVTKTSLVCEKRLRYKRSLTSRTLSSSSSCSLHRLSHWQRLLLFANVVAIYAARSRSGASGPRRSPSVGRGCGGGVCSSQRRSALPSAPPHTPSLH